MTAAGLSRAALPSEEDKESIDRIISQFDEVGNLVQLYLSLFTAGRRNAPAARIVSEAVRCGGRRGVVGSRKSIAVWRFPIEVSQSRIGGRNSPSHACTIIALKLAEIVHRNGIDLPTLKQTDHFEMNRKLGGGDLTATVSDEAICINAQWNEQKMMTKGNYREKNTNQCPSILIQSIIEAILSGNDTHTQLIDAGRKELNFTIPDALVATGNNFQEIDFHAYRFSIAQYLPRCLLRAIKSPLLVSLERINFLAIAYERTVLIIFDRFSRLFMLVDTHLHINKNISQQVCMGSIVAACSVSNLPEFGPWIAENIFPETQLSSQNRREEFELSVLDFCGLPRELDCIRVPHTRFSIKCEDSKENCYILPRYHQPLTQPIVFHQGHQSLSMQVQQQQPHSHLHQVNQLKRPLQSSSSTMGHFETVSFSAKKRRTRSAWG
ncbi:hypothetical protein WR25_15052 isoform A [Diploscapter pachys]|uniref:Uncharacterized protein n=1 Tax=Diploscapter pachys TaxID=2018661 RepID=A0A2A2L0N2_9BILA|nr:hypothetical protein WR25_15052 isoform A [Diploscapter pachys]